MDTLCNLAHLLSTEPGGREEAKALYRQALVVEPDKVNALCNLANLLSKEPSGREEAEALYRRALVLEPDDVDTLNRLGRFLSMDLERLDEAERSKQSTCELSFPYIVDIGSKKQINRNTGRERSVRRRPSELI